MSNSKPKIINKLINIFTEYFLFGLIFIVVVFSATLFIFILLPKYRSIMNTMNSAKVDIQETIHGRRNFLEELKKSSGEIAGIDEYTLKKLEDMLPESVDMSGMISVLNKISEKSGFVLEDVKYLEESSDELENLDIPEGINHADFLVTISGGGYSELKSFLQMVADNVNIVDVSGIMFDGTRKYDLELKAYYIKRALDNNSVVDISDNLKTGLFERKEFLNLRRYDSLHSVDSISAIAEDGVTPPPIKDLVVSDPSVGDRLNLFWENTPSSITSKIKIYRFETEDGKGELIAELGKETAFFVDKGLIPNKTYYYLVKTVSDKNVVSKNNKKYFGTPVNIIPPEAPFDVKILKVDKSIEVSWTNPECYDLEYVYIYKSEDRSLLGELSAKIQAYAGKKQSWDDKATEIYNQYYYTLVAVDNAGNRSPDQIVKFGNSDLFEIKKEQ